MPNKRANDFTEEEKTRIITKARETSFRKAAEEFGINRNTIKYWAAQRSIAAGRKTSGDFTNEEKLAIIKRAEKVGLIRAAKENSTSRQAIIAWKQRLKEMLQVENHIDLTEKSQPNIQRNSTSELHARVDQKDAIRDKPLAEQSEREISLQNEIASLILENAILKEKIEALSRQLSKFSSAIENLTTIDVKASGNPLR